MGYCGGRKQNPTYRSLGDHSETVQLDFDPAVVSYEDLLRIFWSDHDPISQPYSRQYASIIFYHDAEQEAVAVATKAREEKERRVKLSTEIAPFSDFWLAEDYHQKYYLRGSELMREFRRMYSINGDFVNSTAAARVNGYLGGYGTVASLRQEIDSLGLLDAGKQALLETVRARHGERVLR